MAKEFDHVDSYENRNLRQLPEGEDAKHVCPTERDVWGTSRLQDYVLVSSILLPSLLLL